MKRSRILAALTATATASLMATAVAPAQSAQDPSQLTRKFRQAVTPAAIGAHLDAFQAIADQHGDRASGTSGYNASRDYVVQKLRAAGYKPSVQAFEFPYFAEKTPTVLEQVSPDAQTYAAEVNFNVMSFSGSGDVTAPVVAVDTTFTATGTSTSGCEAADFAGFPAGSIALMQRGSCPFALKAENAKAAGAAAAIIFNRGDAGQTGVLNGTLGGYLPGIPVVGTDFATGVDLGTPAGTVAHVKADTVNETRTTYNVIADTAKGDPSNTIAVGAHLDSVEGGPGINDNGSGSATILAVAEQLAKQKKLTNKVRFAWWGAEELGLLGSYHYVEDLAANNPEALKDIAMYLNFDMVGSPNYVRFVYDGDNSLGTGVDGPAGSGEIEQIFTRYFSSVGLASQETVFSGRSDYAGFLDAGIPSGGLFTGAEGVKTAEQAAIFGGEAGVAYDACYHQACDDRSNVNMDAIDEMGDAVAHSVFYLAQTTYDVNGKNKKRGKKEFVAPVAGEGDAA